MQYSDAILIAAVLQEAARLAEHDPDHKQPERRNVQHVHILGAMQSMKEVAISLKENGLLQGLPPLCKSPE